MTIISFSVIHLLPGNPAAVILGSQATPHLIAITEQKLGLNRPLVIQYASWFGNIWHGDFGTSLINGEPVSSEIARSLPPTLELIVFAFLIALAVGVPIGVFSAQTSKKTPELLLRTGVLLGISTPTFVLGSLLILAGNAYFSGVRMLGYVPFSQNPTKSLEVMFWPALTLALSVLAVVVRFTRVAMSLVLQEDYIFIARAMGIKKLTLIYKNALKNALLPLVGALGAQLAYLIGGVVVIEEVFNIPGLGSLTLTAINNRDYTVLQGIVLFVATVIIVINIMISLIYRKLDPRVTG